MRDRVSIVCVLRCAACGVLALALLSAGGCERPARRPALGAPEIDVTRVETRDDITEIVQYWRPMPWLYDSDGQPVGLRVTVHFVSGETDRGAFVPGRILIWLYEFEPGEDGAVQRRSVYGWEFDESESMLYRVRKKAIGGYYYGFPLVWGPEVDVAGRDIEVVIGYQRLNGSLLTAPGKRLSVPAPARYRSRPVRPPRAPTSTQPARGASGEQSGAPPDRPRPER